MSSRNLQLKRTQNLDFNAFPAEIRMKIWLDAMEGQHIVVRQNHEHQTKVRHHFSQVRIPAALHVCRESRNEILPRYTMVSLDDAEREGHRRLSPRPSPKWYVNFEIDTFVFVGYDYLLDKAFEAMGEHSRMIRSLAFSLDLYGDIPEQSVRSMRGKLPHLNAIYIHVGNETQHNQVKVYDPCQEHIPEVWTHSMKLKWDWNKFTASLEERIAQYWDSQAAPLKGIVACDSLIEPRQSKEATFNLGELRDWMRRF
jgi:hypothetical protein